MKYSEKLKDPRWQKKRLEIFNRDEWSCQKCGDSESTLNVHHKKYFNGVDPWDIDDELLITLCNECHEYERETFKDNASTFMEILKEIGYMSDDVLWLAHAFSQIKYFNNPELVRGEIASFVYSLSKPETQNKVIKKHKEKINATKPGNQT